MSDTDDLAISAPLIQHYEECILHPYPDANGIPTIGWGNTIYRNGDRVTLQDPPLAQADADELFEYWLSEFRNKVASHAIGANANQLAAFTSLAYNIGVGAFANSTALRAYLSGNTALAGNGIEMWDKSGGRVLLGLQRRRRAERLVFDGGAVVPSITQAEADFPSG